MNSTSKPVLKIDWATHEAAKFACLNWHYSGTLPPSKSVKIAVYEGAKFIGVVVFGVGATPNLCKPYGLHQTECCELVRIALTRHVNTVSKILAVAIRFLRAIAPGLRLIVSYADPDQGHVGGVYQASNWVYTGLVNVGTTGAFIVGGKRLHPRTIGHIKGGVQSIAWVRANLDVNAQVHITAGKHKYLMPLDAAMREQIAPLAKPYPKRVKQAMAGVQPEQRRSDTDPPAPLTNNVIELNKNSKPLISLKKAA